MHQGRLTVGRVALNHEMGVQVLSLVPNATARPCQVGRRAQNCHDRVRLPGSGPNAGVAQKVERHVEGVRVGGPKPSSSTTPE